MRGTITRFLSTNGGYMIRYMILVDPDPKMYIFGTCSVKGKYFSILK